MKKYLLLIVILLILAFGFLGFNLYTRYSTIQPGEYYCDAQEFGMMTSYPVYNILPDNQMEDIYNGAQGEWRNHPLSNTVTFSGDISLEKATYNNKETNIHLVTIRPEYMDRYRSAQFIIVDNSALQCYLAYPLGE